MWLNISWISRNAATAGVRSRRAHLSRSGQLQSLMGTNGLSPAANRANDVDRVYAGAHVDGIARVHAIFTNSCEPKIERRDPRACQAEPDVCADAAACNAGERSGCVGARLVHSAARHGIAQIPAEFRCGGLINVLRIDKNVNRHSSETDRTRGARLRTMDDNCADGYGKSQLFILRFPFSYGGVRAWRSARE